MATRNNNILLLAVLGIAAFAFGRRGAVPPPGAGGVVSMGGLSGVTFGQEGRVRQGLALMGQFIRQPGQTLTISGTYTYSTTKNGLPINWNYAFAVQVWSPDGIVFEFNPQFTNDPGKGNQPYTVAVPGAALKSNTLYDVRVVLWAADAKLDGTPALSFKILAEKNLKGAVKVLADSLVSAGSLGDVTFGQSARRLLGRRRR